jgi:hypothetical protein
MNIKNPLIFFLFIFLVIPSSILQPQKIYIGVLTMHFAKFENEDNS